MSDDQDDASKTEDPTAKKLEDSRSKGQVVRSQEVTIWFGLLAAFAFLFLLAPGLMARVTDVVLPFVERPHDFETTLGALGATLSDVMLRVLLLLALPVLLFMVAGIVPSLLQFGLLWSFEQTKPKLSKISPLAGLKRMFSVRSLVEFTKGLVKIGIVGSVATLILLPEFDKLEQLLAVPPADILDQVYWLALRLLIGVLVVLTVIAVADYAYQRYDFMKRMRMTRQEVRDEHKQAEGDPMIKARLRQIRQERARQRMMTSVPRADVVITNPTHFAVALEYDQERMAAPKLVAKGVDHLAQRIRELALESDVPLVENPPVARALYQSCEIDEEIPVEHYKAVAEIISYVWRIKRRFAPA